MGVYDHPATDQPWRLGRFGSTLCYPDSRVIHFQYPNDLANRSRACLPLVASLKNHFIYLIALQTDYIRSHGNKFLAFTFNLKFCVPQIGHLGSRVQEFFRDVRDLKVGVTRWQCG